MSVICLFARGAKVAGMFAALGLSLSVLRAQPAVTMSLGQNFTASTYGVNTQALPADSNGAIGPRHFVEFINGSFAVYNKTNGQKVKRLTDRLFWSNAGVVLSSDAGITDPRIIYDPTVQRWFACMVDFDANAPSDPTLESNDFLLAVSDSPDPTGAWHGFLFQADPDSGDFADFPTLGVDSNAVYLSGDIYFGQDNPIGPALVSFPKADLLSAIPTITNRTWFGVMTYGGRGQVLQPAICFDGTSSGTIIATSDIGNDSSPHSNLVSFAVQNGATSAASLSPATFIPTPTWTVPDSPYLPAPQFGVIQPDGTDALLANDARISAKAYAVNGVLYAVHNTEYNGHIAIRWYRVRTTDNTLLESGTIADPNLDLFFPSIAANTNGVVVICFNASGPTTYVSTFAVAGHTLNGATSFGSRLLLQASTLDYHGDDETVAALLGEPPVSRWGDYSATSVDPSDPNRFWTIQMYPSNTDVWSTQITELVTVPPALPGPLLSITHAGANATIAWPSSSGGYQLQSTTNLVASSSWSTVTQPQTTNGNQVYVQVPISSGLQFFRLKK
jgi:hypothetical protein